MIPPTRNNTDGSSPYQAQVFIRLITLIGRDIVKRFPALEMLDNEPIVKVGFDAPTPQTNPSHRHTPKPTTNSFPHPMAPPFVMGVNGALISDFLTRCVDPNTCISSYNIFILDSLQSDSSPSSIHNDPTFWMCIIPMQHSHFLPIPRFLRELGYRDSTVRSPIKRILNGMFG